MIRLGGSVGFGSANNRDDVVAIQNALNGVTAARGGPDSPLRADGIAGPQTKAAIVHFQQHHFRWADGRISPRGPTLRALNHIITPSAPPAGVPPLSPSEIRSATRGVPVVAAPDRRGELLGSVVLLSGEVWLIHGTGRTQLVAGLSYPVAGPMRIATYQGSCKILYLTGGTAVIRPETLVIIHGGQAERIRDEGTHAVLRPGADMSRLRALSGD